MVNREGNTRLIQINVDVQNDFCPGGSLAVDNGDEVIAPLNKLAKVVRGTEGGFVVVTRDVHPETTEHFKKWPVHCVENTEGAELHTDLDYNKALDLEVLKGQTTTDDGYSGFEGRDYDGRTLDSYIWPRSEGEKRHILIGGLATDYCVKATVLDALKVWPQRNEDGQKDKYGRSIAVYALTDAMRAVNIEPADGEKALAEMEAAGAILTTTDEVIQRIQRGEL